MHREKSLYPWSGFSGVFHDCFFERRERERNERGHRCKFLIARFNFPIFKSSESKIMLSIFKTLYRIFLFYDWRWQIFSRQSRDNIYPIVRSEIERIRPTVAGIAFKRVHVAVGFTDLNPRSPLVISLDLEDQKYCGTIGLCRRSIFISDYTETSCGLVKTRRLTDTRIEQ